MPAHSRRSFLGLAVGLIGAPLVRPSYGCTHGSSTPRGPHPTPRAGITAAKVATRAQLPDNEDVIALFDQVRAIPGVLDGVRCNCGCAEYKDYYSLLSCFETPDVMAKDCLICQNQGRLIVRLHKSGKSLDEIRRGVDARFG